MAKKKVSQVSDLELVGLNESTDILSTIDTEKIEKLQSEINTLKKELSEKVYAIKFQSESGLADLKDFMFNHAEWTNNEALGVIEVCKILEKIEIEKENTIFIESMPLQAIHYFLSKQKGTGLITADRFISVFKPVSVALESTKKDNEKIAFLEKSLAAAQQGIEVA